MEEAIPEGRRSALKRRAASCRTSSNRRDGFTQPVPNAEALRQTVKWHFWHEYGASLPEGERSTLGRIRRELY